MRWSQGPEPRRVVEEGQADGTAPPARWLQKLEAGRGGGGVTFSRWWRPAGAQRLMRAGRSGKQENVSWKLSRLLQQHNNTAMLVPETSTQEYGVLAMMKAPLRPATGEPPSASRSKRERAVYGSVLAGGRGRPTPVATLVSRLPLSQKRTHAFASKTKTTTVVESRVQYRQTTLHRARRGAQVRPPRPYRQPGRRVA